MTPRPSTKRGQRWLNQVSTELGEGQYRTCVVEHSFICPFCGEEISMVLDLSVRRHTYVEDDSLAHFKAKNFE